ncbi:hypothetical protein Hamer_G025141 [Homarus americanus]|uniref:Uncharacterized protein n=1 Tax=Homarus americanus TaxID=6706 RepID=A0A8J5MRN5_HOMAM|nr:hypothetical protein Hamer_G025141 [Homarus americanus]
MYRARVGRNWAGEGTTHYGTCYTSWGSEIMASASIAASISYTPSYYSTKAINGFYRNILTRCYSSVSMTNTYLAISIGLQQLVNSVRNQTFPS